LYSAGQHRLGPGGGQFLDWSAPTSMGDREVLPPVPRAQGTSLPCPPSKSPPRTVPPILLITPPSFISMAQPRILFRTLFRETSFSALWFGGPDRGLTIESCPSRPFSSVIFVSSHPPQIPRTREKGNLFYWMWCRFSHPLQPRGFWLVWLFRIFHSQPPLPPPHWSRLP